MNQSASVLPCVLFAVVLVAVSSSAVPGSEAAAQAVTAPAAPPATSIFLPIVALSDPPPSLSPQQTVYSNLQQEVYGQLTIYINDAETYHDRYLTFMYSQQLLNRDTTELQNDLDNFDSYYSQAKTGLTAAKAAVGGDPGLDASGAVTDPEKYNSSVQAALNSDWTTRNFLNLAVYQLHSGLLQYQYIWGPNVGIPDVPKWHLAPYQLP
jgi:hypothetical protein